jgi:hypothetical protein
MCIHCICTASHAFSDWAPSSLESTSRFHGRSGFVGSYCILQLLAAGHAVRTTLRDLRREGDVRAMLKEGGAEPGNRWSFMAADLEKDDGWRGAVAGCEYLLHVASPMPSKLPKNEDELIAPAREGVRRRIICESFSAIYEWWRISLCSTIVCCRGLRPKTTVC